MPDIKYGERVNDEAMLMEMRDRDAKKAMRKSKHARPGSKSAYRKWWRGLSPEKKDQVRAAFLSGAGEESSDG